MRRHVDVKTSTRLPKIDHVRHASYAINKKRNQSYQIDRQPTPSPAPFVVDFHDELAAKRPCCLDRPHSVRDRLGGCSNRQVGVGLRGSFGGKTDKM